MLSNQTWHYIHKCVGILIDVTNPTQKSVAHLIKKVVVTFKLCLWRRSVFSFYQNLWRRKKTLRRVTPVSLATPVNTHGLVPTMVPWHTADNLVQELVVKHQLIWHIQGMAHQHFGAPALNVLSCISTQQCFSAFFKGRQILWFPVCFPGCRRGENSFLLEYRRHISVRWEISVSFVFVHYFDGHIF